MIKKLFSYLGYTLAIASIIAVTIKTYTYFEGIKKDNLTKENVREIFREENKPILDSLNAIKTDLVYIGINQINLLHNDTILRNQALKQLKMANQWNDAIRMIENFTDELKKKDLNEIVFQE
jgi:hypothetical protein